MHIGLALAVAFGLGLTLPAVARNLPSDVEQHYGIPPNAANRDGSRSRYQNPPSDWEQQRRRAYRYQRDYDERSYRPAYRYQPDYDDRHYRPAYRYYYR